MTLLPVQKKVFIFTWLEHPEKIRQTDRKRAPIDTKVIYENFNNVLNQVSRNRNHATLEGRESIAQAERHSPVRERSVWAGERRLLLIARMDLNLKET